MRPLTPLFALALPLFVACAGVQTPKDQLTDPGALLFNGWAKPEVDCWKCHNGDGRGATGPSLVHKVPRRTAEELKQTITNGDGFMPKFRSKLSDDELAQLVGWLQAKFPAAAK